MLRGAFTCVVAPICADNPLPCFYMAANAVLMEKATSRQAESLEALCTRLIQSDRIAFEAIFRGLREDLVRYARSIVGSDTIAHDLIQDVFVSLWGLRETLDPSQSLKAYLYRMARNRALRYLRDERTHAQKHLLLHGNAPPAARAEQTEEKLDADALRRQLQTWLSEMPERQREALLLSRMHGLSHREIATLMDLSPRTVNNHIVRALAFLQERIEAFEPTLLRP